MVVQCRATRADFQGLENDWSSLAERCDGISIFQTYEWQSIWWKHYGSGTPYVLLAYADSQLVALLPLYRSSEEVPLTRPLRRIRPVGVGGDTSPDYLGPISLSEYARESAAAFTAFLFEHHADWDVLELTDLFETSSLLAQVREARPPAGCRTVLSPPNRIQFTELPRSWDDYLGSLTSHARYSVRNLRRKFLSLPSSRLFEWTDADGLDSAIDRLIELHRQRWQRRAEHFSFSTSQYNDFHRELMHAFLERGWLRLYCMELAGELIGVFYGYSFRGTLYHFQGGFDPAHEKLRIGQCLMAFAIESAIAEGCTGLDMLRGEYDYKKRWAPSVRQTFSYQVSRATPPAYVRQAFDRFLGPAGRRSYRFLKSLVSHGSHGP